jgi:hypothetical protein
LIIESTRTFSTDAGGSAAARLTASAEQGEPAPRSFAASGFPRTPPRLDFSEGAVDDVAARWMQATGVEQPLTLRGDSGPDPDPGAAWVEATSCGFVL